MTLFDEFKRNRDERPDSPAVLIAAGDRSVPITWREFARDVEAIAWMAGANLPVVICNVMRGGPGIGSIQPSQQDYFQATKASGNGGFRMLVLAPSTLQEAVDMVYDAFDLAMKYKNPVLVLCDGFTGAMMEPVVLPEAKIGRASCRERV